MSSGGNGLMALYSTHVSDPERYKLLRLAYLLPPRITFERPTPGHFVFYELWNQPAWARMAENCTALEALQAGARDGTILLQRLVRVPDGRLAVREYDLTNATITELTPSYPLVGRGSGQPWIISKDLWITNYVVGEVTYEPLPPAARRDHEGA